MEHVTWSHFITAKLHFGSSVSNCKMKQASHGARYTAHVTRRTSHGARHTVHVTWSSCITAKLHFGSSGSNCKMKQASHGARHTAHVTWSSCITAKLHCCIRDMSIGKYSSLMRCLQCWTSI